MIPGLSTTSSKHTSVGSRFGAANGQPTPWVVGISRNNVLSRSVVELLGYLPWNVAFARNRYEKAEKVLDTASWFAMGLGIPILLDRAFNRFYSTQFIKRHFKDLALKNPLSLPFEQLDRTILDNTHKAGELAKKLGLKELEQLPNLVKRIRTGKLLLLLIDTALMAAHGQLFFWGRNWMTEKLSGKKGFSGEFNYATNDYLQQKTANYEKEKSWRKTVGISAAFTAAAVLPLALGLILKSKSTSLLGKLKRLPEKFNYHDVVYMSKWTILWSVLFNYNLAGLLAARDSHERREHLSKALVLDFFYFIGDDLFSGLAAKVFQKRRAKELGGLQLVSRGFLGLPRAIAPHEIYDKIEKASSTEGKALATRLAKVNFWIGILATSLCLGIGTTLINNWYTKKKVLADLGQQQKTRPSLGGPPLRHKTMEEFLLKPFPSHNAWVMP